MFCHKCKSKKTRVVDTSPSVAEVPLVSRKRLCVDCGAMFNTIERVVKGNKNDASTLLDNDRV
jgi:transcriptional regulator NrdR family protein